MRNYWAYNPCVYVVEVEKGLYKIGHTQNVPERMKQLRRGTQIVGKSFPLRLVCVWETPIYKEVEREMHDFFADKRVVNELFALTDEDITKFQGTVTITEEY